MSREYPKGSLMENLAQQADHLADYNAFEELLLTDTVYRRVTPKIDKPGIPTAYELAERRTKLQKSYESLQREMDLVAQPRAASPQVQYEKLLVDYFTLTRKLESISVAMNAKGVALSLSLADRVLERVRSLHANAVNTHRKLTNCHHLHIKRHLKRETVLPEGPKNLTDYIHGISIIEADHKISSVVLSLP